MKKFLTTLLLLCATSYSWAQEVIGTTSEEVTAEKRGRTVKIDREINNNVFVFKGESMAGLTVSYSTLESEDSNIALIFDQLNLRGQIFSIKPHYGFFYRDNNAIGVRLGYNFANGQLDSAALNLGDAADINLSIGDVSYLSRGFSAAIYHRSYMSIDKKGRFGLFADLLEQDRLFADDREVAWLCLNCGQIVHATAAPNICPVCRHGQDWFIRLELAPFTATAY